MSELDKLSVRSLSGVPMRPKGKPPDTLPQTMAQLASDMSKLTNVLTRVLTSSPANTRRVKIEFQTGPENLISGGTVVNGDRKWKLTFTRHNGQVSVTALPE